MIFNRIRREFPVFFPQFNQPLRQPHGILKMHVRIHRPMTNQQRAFQALCKVYGRAFFISLRIRLWVIQNVRCVRMIVMRPIRDRTQSRARRETSGSVNIAIKVMKPP